MSTVTITPRSPTVGTTAYGLASGSTTVVAQTSRPRVNATIDWSTLAAGDTYQVQLQMKSGAGVTMRAMSWTISGPSPGLWLLQQGPGIQVGGDWEITVQKLAGTDRAIEASLIVSDDTAGGGGGASAADIADAVWDELASGHVGAGSFGQLVDSIDGNVAAVEARLPASPATAASVAAVQTDVDDIQARLPATLVGGRMDVSVGAMAASVLTAAAIAADAITAAKVAADVTTEIQTGLATSAALATLQADTDDIQTRLPAALVSGRMDVNVSAMAASVLTPSAIADNAITANKLANGAITAAKIATDAIDADALAADAIAEIADAVWDELTAGHAVVGSFGEHVVGLTGGGGGGPTAAAIADAVWDELASGHVVAGSFGELLDVVDGNTSAVQSRLPAAPAEEPSLLVVGADVLAVQARLPVALVGGRMDSSLGAAQANSITASSITDNALTSNKFANGFLTANKFAADAIDSAALSATAVTEIVAAIWNAARATYNGVGSFGEGVRVNTVNTNGISAGSFASDALALFTSAASVAAAVLAQPYEGTKTVGAFFRNARARLWGKATVLDGDGTYSYRNGDDTADQLVLSKTGSSRTITGEGT